jgi:hypothetical protein
MVTYYLLQQHGYSMFCIGLPVIIDISTLPPRHQEINSELNVMLIQLVSRQHHLFTKPNAVSRLPIKVITKLKHLLLIDSSNNLAQAYVEETHA